MNKTNTDYSKLGIAIASALEAEKYGLDASQRIFQILFAVRRDEAKAQYHVGRVYADGDYGFMDPFIAFDWISKAASQGLASAQWKLGRMYSTGESVPKDDVKALALYRLAADQGLREAQHSMGVRYLNGKGGLTPDRDEAMRWFRLAGTI